MKKDFLREVRKSFARFLSILLIVALGVAFFSGIKSAAPAMRASADATYDSEKFMDICIQSSLGLTERDIDEIAKINGIEDVEGSYDGTFLCRANETEVVTSVLALTDRINLVRVTEGRYPEKYYECIADRRFLEKTGHKIGDQITLSTGNDSVLSDTLATELFTIVGVGNTAYYLSDERGRAEIGNGTVDAFLIVPKQAFTMTAFTKIFIRVKNATELNCFSSKYDRTVEQVVNNIKVISDTRCDVRYSEFKEESTNLIMRAERRFEDRKQKALDQLEKAYQELSDAQSALDIAQSEIDARKQEIEDAKFLLDSQEENLPENLERVQKARNDLADLEAQYRNARVQLNYNNDVISKLEEELRQGAAKMSSDEYAEAASVIYGYKYLAQVYQSSLDAIQYSIGQANIRIDKYEQVLNGSPEAIAEARLKVETGDEELQKAQKELNDRQGTLDVKKEEYELSKKELTEEFNDAQAKLDAYKLELENTPRPTWYITGREIVDTYAAFDNDASGISAIGSIFPIIFFLVAALISLTTMTRMVEEQRSQIGTLKSLGYSGAQISLKYILYSLSASLIGSVAGVLLGEGIIPKMVVNTYKLVYVNLTKILTPFNFVYAAIASVVAILCTTLAAFYAVRKSLKQAPAVLMRPKSPVVGKKILLERFKGFWIRLNYGQKASLRNLVRYKKRLFMTLFGVAGCMALLIVGFGIRDSVTSMSQKQYNEIFNYQGTVTINEGLGKTERRHLLSDIQLTPGVVDYLQTYRAPAFAVKGTTEQDAYIVVPQNVDYLGDYISLNSRFSKQSIAPDDQSVIITEKLAKILGVKAGDTISFKLGKDAEKTIDIQVKGITENYIYHYVYMTPAVYKMLFGQSASLNTLLIRSHIGDEAAFSRQILSLDGVTSVTMNSASQQQLLKTTDSLMVIVVLMIVSAALLAFVVLYNLNNINITERRRELATLKVLGFYPDEMRKYVFRENVILTLIGMVIGVALGLLLHFMVMRSVETDTMMFGMDIKWYSFVLSFALTAVFSVIVNLFMSFKLKKIDMVESLKSIE